MDTRRVHVRVRGKVHGVTFRAQTQARARELGLTGWVRNEPRDARTQGDLVTLEAQGRGDAVDALVAWCHHGPPMARVEDVAASARELVAGEGAFRIDRGPTSGASS